MYLCYYTLYLVRPERSWGTEDTKGVVIFWMFGGLYLILKWSIRSLQFQKHTNLSNHRCINTVALHVRFICKCVSVYMLLIDSTKVLTVCFTCERMESVGNFWLMDRLLAMRKLLLGVGVLSLLSGDVMKLIFVVEEKEGGPGEGWF